MDYELNEIARYYLSVSNSLPTTVQHFASSESGKYIAMVYYDYPDSGGIQEKIEVYDLIGLQYIKIHDLEINPNELIREFKFSQNERVLFLSDIKLGRVRKLLLNQDTNYSIAYDPLIDYSISTAIPNIIKIPGHENELLIREVYSFNNEVEE